VSQLVSWLINSSNKPGKIIHEANKKGVFKYERGISKLIQIWDFYDDPISEWTVLGDDPSFMCSQRST